ncbi:adenylate kinase [Buchnera aphidicola (Nipponaphis monzeni)]|uniref:Adenylate kinase n=1 Tax=Buchnera aphidicola (Nipponaphis monzeni) TaxID=2495405 RepID=A0A455TAH4_9GAMM|nr:nucleoside monophosphate kinase [Buchnera aphidicola]BBI01367.1 adenylate kinase [Buchnera aphidicola (Nipponaphis monzeni)]
MRIIMLGPPGSGKGTQSNFITKKYNITKISIGDILRNAFKKNKNFQNYITKQINQGKLVADNIVYDLLKKRILKKDCKNGFLLDGFPRNLKQAYMLTKEKIHIEYVIELLVSTYVLKDRIKNRMIHVPSGRIYHTVYNPPKKLGFDDITGEILSIRKDDTNKILQLRLKEYKSNIQLLTKYYLKQSKKKYLKYFKINGNNNIQRINHEINIVLKKNN